MNKIIAIVVIIAGLIIAGVFGGYQWSEADNAKTIAALNKKVYDQGVKIQNAENKTGELNRKLKLSNRGRIDAIKTNDHNTTTIKQLQTSLDKSVKKLADVQRYIILNIDSIKRVYDHSRHECNGLPGSIDSPIIPAQLSEFTGDSVTGVVREIAGRYCSVATDYNNLYKTCETLLAGKKNPR
jgi:hypothetical protein